MEEIEAVAIRLIRGELEQQGERQVTVIRPCVDCPHTRRHFGMRTVDRLVGKSVAEVVSCLIGLVPILFLGNEKVRLFLRPRENADDFVARLRLELFGVEIIYHPDRCAVDLFDCNFRPVREQDVTLFYKDPISDRPVPRTISRPVSPPPCPIFFAVAPSVVLKDRGLCERVEFDRSIPCPSYTLFYAVCDACAIGEKRQLALWGFERLRRVRPALQSLPLPPPAASVAETSVDLAETGDEVRERVDERTVSVDLRRLTNPATRRATVDRFVERLTEDSPTGETVRIWSLRHLAHLDSDEFIKYFQCDFGRIFPCLYQADATEEMRLLSGALMSTCLSVSSRDAAYANDGVYLLRMLNPLKADMVLTPLNLKCYAAILVFSDRVLSVESKVRTLLSRRSLMLAFDALFFFSQMATSVTNLAVLQMTRIALMPAFFELHITPDGAKSRLSVGEVQKAAAESIMKGLRIAIRSGNSGRQTFPIVSMILSGSEQSPVLARVMGDRRFLFALKWLEFATGVPMEKITVAASRKGKFRLAMDFQYLGIKDDLFESKHFHGDSAQELTDFLLKNI